MAGVSAVTIWLSYRHVLRAGFGINQKTWAGLYSYFTELGAQLYSNLDLPEPTYALDRQENTTEPDQASASPQKRRQTASCPRNDAGNTPYTPNGDPFQAPSPENGRTTKPADALALRVDTDESANNLSSIDTTTRPPTADTITQAAHFQSFTPQPDANPNPKKRRQTVLSPLPLTLTSITRHMCLQLRHQDFTRI